MLMAFHQIFISNSVQLLGLVLIGLEEKDQQKQKTKQNKTKQNKTKQKPRKKTTTKQFDHFIFKICQNQYFTLA
jgi:hypothetical protein